MVLTFYAPHVHNVAFLRSLAKQFDASLIDAWPRDSREHPTLFEKLKDAYVTAHYSKHYTITTAQLEWLGRCVEALGAAVHAAGSDRIEILGNQSRFHFSTRCDLWPMIAAGR